MTPIQVLNVFGQLLIPWSIKQILQTYPLIENKKYISNFKEKANIFNKYFAMQCRPLNTESYLPSFTPLTDETLNNGIFEEANIASIIKKLNSKKAHGFDGISIAMLK